MQNYIKTEQGYYDQNGVWHQYPDYSRNTITYTYPPQPETIEKKLDRIIELLEQIARKVK